MFGLDARIALGIFGALSIIAGAYTAMSLSSIYASSFSKELEETAKALEAIHYDLKQDLHSQLINNTDKQAFIALYDKMALEPGKARGRWLGPYIKATTPIHPRYGETRIVKRAGNVDQDCFPEEVCFLWLSYDNVKEDIAEQLNETFDGIHEQIPATHGRLQWREGYDDKTTILYFRASQTIGGSGYSY
ncbi:MAG: hypothetical protein OXQ96_06095 [Alphaproteobacteria bacterium]|nr:hypothetical protein [Alphaproteobacteria bacterium]